MRYAPKTTVCYGFSTSFLCYNSTSKENKHRRGEYLLKQVSNQTIRKIDTQFRQSPWYPMPCELHPQFRGVTLETHDICFLLETRWDMERGNYHLIVNDTDLLFSIFHLDKRLETGRKIETVSWSSLQEFTESLFDSVILESFLPNTGKAFGDTRWASKIKHKKSGIVRHYQDVTLYRKEVPKSLRSRRLSELVYPGLPSDSEILENM